MMNKALIAFTCLLAVVGSTQAATVYETAKEANLDILVAAVKAAGLKDVLNDPHLVATIFAPTDAAFEKLLEALDVTAEELLADTELLVKVLKYHVIAGAAIESSELPNVHTAKTLLGKSITLFKSVYSGKVRVYFGKPSGGATSIGFTGHSKVVVPNVVADKAIVHVIDTVLLP